MVTLDVLLWTFLASFVIHIVDETLMNGGFVQWFRTSFVRYGLVTGQIDAADFWTGALLGVLTAGAFLTVVPTVLVPCLIRSRMQQTAR